MVRFIFLCFFFLAGVGVIHAQQLNQSVIAPDGGSAVTKSMHIDWTLGEPVIEDGYTQESWYTAGFQQPVLTVLKADPHSLISTRSATTDINVMPNPVRSTLQIHWPDHIEKSITVILSDPAGATMTTQSLRPSMGDDQIDMSHFTSGLYWLSFYNDQKELLQVFRISKIQ